MKTLKEAAEQAIAAPRLRTYQLERTDSTAPPTAATRPSTGEQLYVIINSWLAANKATIRKPAKTYVTINVLSMLKRVALPYISAGRAQLSCSCIKLCKLAPPYPSNAQTSVPAPQPHPDLKIILALMSDPSSSSSQFPSGISDPPIFKRLGPKDRSHLRQNIETLHFDNMSTEQTYVQLLQGGVNVNGRCG